MTNGSIGLGSGQPLHVADERELLESLEEALDLCLATGEALAIFDWQGEFCQAAVDGDGDMHVESSFGELVKHAGFLEPVIEHSWLWGNRLPAEWHARPKMAAGAMTRAFITGGMTFPTVLAITVMATGASKPKEPPIPHTEGAPTLGFLYAEDRPRGDFVVALAAAEGLDPATASTADLTRAIQLRLQADYGPLNLLMEYPSDAEIIVTLDVNGVEVSGRD